ncbi:MAG: COQ9 family protein [Pseudomonadota bacterium]
MTDRDVKSKLLQSIKPHVPFDGWSEAAFRAACEDAEISSGLAKAACPRGAIDLAIAFHQEGDAEMVARVTGQDQSALRYSEKVAAAIRHRLEAIEDKELVRRGATLFALPNNVADGAKLIWGTSDKIWKVLGDTSEDHNWYTKRATLSGVYSATVLFWLGDESPEQEATWSFLERRIDDVMRVEKIKAKLSENQFISSVMKGPLSLLSRIRAPGSRPEDMPGSWSR